MPVENNIEIRAKNYPVLALRGLVCFPNMMLTFDVGRKKSIKAVTAAMDLNQKIYLVAQKDIAVDDPKEEDLYKIGCIAKVRQVLKGPDGTVKILVEGKTRAVHHNMNTSGAYITADVEPLADKPIKNREIYKETLVRRIRGEFEKFVEVSRVIAPDVVMTVATSEDIAFLSDFIAFSIPAPFDDKQFVLEQLNPVNRAKVLLEMLSKEREIALIDSKIGEKTRLHIDENQKEYYLKEQIRAISEELYGDDSASEADDYYKKIAKLSASDEVKEKLNSQVAKLAKMPSGSHEGTVVRAWLDTLIELPWGKRTEVSVDIKRAAKILDRDFYGMKKVKDRILEMLSVFALSPEITGQIICLVGPPGVGKTSIGKTIAECMKRKFARVSLGGVHDEAEIRGHRKTYIGAMPGKIINALKQTGSDNSLILLDEIDKLGNDYKGDPASALLEVLDPEQNCTFVDNFVEIPYDLSHAVFITTANSVDTIPAPLLDRMEIIELSSYTREEKFNIAKRHLVSRELSRHALNNKLCRITDEAIYSLIDFYTREAGVRRLQRAIASVCSKVAKRIAEGSDTKVIVKANDIEQMLGVKKYKSEAILEKDEVGIINGLAWTAVGGEIMQLEVAALKGSGKIELTGSLGDVMKESAKAAVSYVRANAEKYGINVDFYKENDIHIHATEAAVPKDGPSAGVTITTALISALTGREVRRDVAMTGEVTIRGRVLAIGGLKEKSMAALRGGIKTVYIPKANLADLKEIDDIVKANVKFIAVEKVEEILDTALLPLRDEKAQEKYNFTLTENTSKRISQ